MGAARSGVDRLSERCRAVARRSEPAEREVAAFAEAVHAGGKGEQVRLVAAHDGAAAARATLAPFADVIVEPFGDIWLRDTGPIFLGSGPSSGARRASASTAGAANTSCDGDEDVGERLAEAAGVPFAKADWVLEGGAIDDDGTGTVRHHRAVPAQPQPQPGLSRERDRSAAARRPRLRARALARRRPDERPYRRPCRQSGALRRRRAGRHPDAGEDDPNAAVYRDAARRAARRSASTSSPCPRPAWSRRGRRDRSRRAT